MVKQQHALFANQGLSSQGILALHTQQCTFRGIACTSLVMSLTQVVMHAVSLQYLRRVERPASGDKSPSWSTL